MFWEYLNTYEDLKNILISIAILLLFLLLRKIFAKYVFTLFLKLTSKVPSKLFSNVWIAFEKPMQWFFIILGIYIAAHYFPYIDNKNLLFLSLIRSCFILLVTWGLFNLSDASSLLFSRINKRYNIEIDNILVPFLSKAIRVIIVAIAITVIAQEFHYDINGFVAGLGLGGLAFALAAKDALANLFGGIIIITEKPFTIGDWISTPSVEGTVEDISFRSTKVRTFTQALVTVPNATLADQPITNWSKMGKRQISFSLKLPADTPREKLETIIQRINDLLKSDPDIHPDMIHVNFDKYMADGFEIFLYFFTKTTEWGEYLKVKEEINYKILEIIKSEEEYNEYVQIQES
ncbi:mechanosensitive ion channel family protein [Lederbergia wuyishanensis]|uniref:MscS family membrane protein n=1 Tax=Lederbergia wuyishanensis TaxID=1347903 RepID=A0ABU0D6L3_9BACI|nr:mechanosensitive ion channel family protein [Lederbergia wuyishanensis]MCJ8008542.1 mechanosensitive ion channel family protein [Lederbergia wuyishanensis]MDQ0344044.1 MscS family membrane protein [Lederbergia wuyishanensis]